MSSSKKLLQAAAGAAGGEALNIEDVFSTYLYTGTGDNQTNTVTNGLDLSGEGGMVWTKGRDIAYNPIIFDSERGLETFLYTNSTAAQENQDARSNMSFNSDGYSFGSTSATSWGPINEGNYNFASWTFRKAPKFFDVVTYTGDGTGTRQLSHNLDSTIGTIIVKRTDGTGDWWVYHRSARSTNTDGYLRLNLTNAEAGSNQIFPVSTYNSTQFTVGNSINVSSETYVAYLFAHNNGDGTFGPTGDQDIIKCGSVTTDGSGNATVDLGFEPQWLMVKSSSSALSGWHMLDNMRGIATGSTYQNLLANSSGAEATSGSNYFEFTADGFKINAYPSGASTDWVYIAIRRGPMAVPTDATDVFDVTLNPTSPNVPSDTLVDSLFFKSTGSSQSWWVADRLRQGAGNLQSDTTAAETSSTYLDFRFDQMTGTRTVSNSFGSNYVGYTWKRAPSFFDVVAYTGNGTAGRTVSHNLGVAPEMIWVKCRNSTTDGASSIAANWWVGVKPKDGGGAYIFSPGLNTNNSTLTSSGSWTDNTATHFKPYSVSLRSGSEGPSGMVSNKKYIAYLFASLDGVSKVFSVTKSSGSDASVNCGFSAGPRFVLLKRTDSTGDWYVWDSERGIVSGNDPYLLLNSTAAEVTSTDYIDPTSNGFTIVNGGLADGDYIGYAVA